MKTFAELDAKICSCTDALTAKIDGSNGKRAILLCGGTGCLSSDSMNIKEKFEEFWKLYTPVKCNGKFIDKGSRKTAEEKFIKILEKGEDYESIIRGCKEYIEHCRENNQLTCGVTVFLNQERWKGDYSGNACKESDSGERQKSRSIVETYAEIAAELAEKDNLW